MTLANAEIRVNEGTGTPVAAHIPAGTTKPIQVIAVAGPDGHIQDSFPTYYFWSGFVAGAANRLALEIFNAVGSGVKVIVRKIFIQSNMATAVHVAQVWDIDRSSTVGTGGTVITSQKADTQNAAAPAGITARAGPTGGATKVATLFSMGLNAEETLPSAALLGMINWVPEGPNIQEIILREGEGLNAKQITSSTTSTWGVLFVVNIL